MTSQETFMTSKSKQPLKIVWVVNFDIALVIVLGHFPRGLSDSLNDANVDDESSQILLARTLPRNLWEVKW